MLRFINPNQGKNRTLYVTHKWKTWKMLERRAIKKRDPAEEVPSSTPAPTGTNDDLDKLLKDLGIEPAVDPDLDALLKSLESGPQTKATKQTTPPVTSKMTVVSHTPTKTTSVPTTSSSVIKKVIKFK